MVEQQLRAEQVMTEPPDSYLYLQTIERNPSLLGVAIVASNGAFRGMAKLYLTPSCITALAQKLHGFPQSVADRRVIELGVAESGAYCQLKCACVDGVGHTAVSVHLLNHPHHHGWQTNPQSTCLDIRFEAAALDRFVKQLQLLAQNQTEKAVLIGCTFPWKSLLMS
jgi:hypothetical protein